jgi:hypothetical protein
MTLGELIQSLEEARDQVGEDVQVLYASQPSYPFENSVRDVHVMGMFERREMAMDAMREEGMDEDEIEKNFDEEELEREEDVVYLEEGCQIGYLPGEAKDLIGW